MTKLKDNILIYGAGGFGKTIYSILSQYFDNIEFADDKKKIGTKIINNIKLKYNLKLLIKKKIKYKICLAIGYKTWDRRLKIIDQLKKKEYEFLSFIHPKSIISPTAKIREGAFINQGTNISENVTVHENSFIDIGVMIGENSIISQNCYLAAGTNICGNTKIMKNSFIGANSLILDNIKIGTNCFINAGSIITRSIKNDKKNVNIQNNIQINLGKAR